MRLVRLVLVALLAPPLFIAAALCAAAAAASWLGRDSLRWDVLAHFAPFWFAGGLAALVVGLFLRGFDRAALVGAGLVAVLAAGGTILPELVRSTGPKAKAAAGAIKVVQFNVWHRNRDMAGVVRWLEAEDPDVAVLQETTPALRAALAANGRWQVACPDCEVVILSKLTPVSTARPQTRTKAEGPLTRATYRDRLGEFTVLGVHNAWPTDGEDQRAQETRLAEAIGQFPPARTFVTGDFNSAPWSFQRRRWDKAFGLPRRDRAVFSWPARQSTHYRWLGVVPFLPIDHVYAGPGWATVSARRGPRLGSDHYPVVVVLAPAT
jgi:endonuclease/exonuclease/phosphatase (EEP) superfamily protein YafD